MRNYIAQVGATLLDRGYPFLPIQPLTKKPGVFTMGAWRDYPRWSKHCERSTTQYEVDAWGNWPEAGVGIATGMVVGIDIDVLDKEVAAQIEDYCRRTLGDTPCVRVGKFPKRLLVYRCEKPFPGFKLMPVEVLGLGQQFVAYGLHPETGQPYGWPVQGLTDVDLQELPVITEEQARDFANKAYELIPAEMRPKTLHTGTINATSGTTGSRQRGTVEAITAALKFLPNEDLDYDSWVRIGMATKGALGDAGWPIFEQWSAQSSKNVPKTTQDSWESFNPTSIGAGTVYHMAMERGWVPDAALQLDGEPVTETTHPAADLLARLQAAIRVQEDQAPKGPPPPTPLPAGWDNVGGVLAGMMDLMCTTAKRPQPVLALAASLCAVGTLMGRKYRTENNTRSNLYVVGIAESGAGKNHSRIVINELFRRGNLLQYIGGNKIASGSGLLAAIQRQPATLFQLDEFGMFMSAAADRKKSPRYLTEIVDLLTELYTTSGTTYFGVEYAHSQHNKSHTHRAIHQPCVCVYGTTTPLHFWQALQAANVADGSLARFLILESDNDFPDSNAHWGYIDPDQRLIDQLVLIHQGGGKLNGNLADAGGGSEVDVDPRVVPATIEATAVFRSLDSELLQRLRESRGNGFTSILARIEENATKLALIRAVSRDPVDPVIDEDDANWGVRISRHCAELTIREASMRISENPIEMNHKRALQILAEAGGVGMSRRDFTRKTQFMDHRQRAGVLNTLRDAGLVEMSLVQNKSRQVDWLRLLPN